MPKGGLQTFVGFLARKICNGTIGEFLIEFMENKVKHSTRTSTYNNQIFMTKKHLLPVLGNKKLKDIKPFDCYFYESMAVF
ncbi:N-terminal phage integrase SAM-like domain-containing protein [Aneurinibacillus aneurinilyticus]|uniref:Integrase SAM-like N-terminal domain-containing protein n=2 Tax=Aneurinibacillus aneurinilyticus TaxID=1391 RepID=U1XAZ9_ANEAE|nr:hypothetical protein HMPREF0083_00170 [Aneurinibacillus aneurinilyticus ATCC 12856]